MIDERLQRLARQVRRFALPTKEDEGFDDPDDDELSPEEFAEEERKRAKIKKIIWASALGNVLEWYDFAIFGFLAKEIGHNFFPPGDEKLQIIESFGVFGGAFLMRPLGGVVFGYLGDKVVGRDKALEFSIIVMAFPTVILGCLPGYSQIGMAAPILLTIIRMVQGLAVGGQLVGSMVTVTESSPKKQVGFYGAMCLTTANGGSLLGSAVGGFMHLVCSEKVLRSYAWRFPFLCGIFLAIAGVRLQRKLQNDPDMANLHGGGGSGDGHGGGDGDEADADGVVMREELKSIDPLRLLYKFYKLQMVTVCCMCALWGTAFYMCYVWMATFEATFVRYPHPESAFSINTAMLSIQVICMPLCGLLVDRFTPQKVILAGSAGMVVISAPMFAWLYELDAAGSVMPQLILCFFVALYGSAVPCLVTTCFPANMRFTGAANGYNMATCIFGGSTPVIATSLAGIPGFPAAPGMFMGTIAFVTFIAALLLPRVVARTDAKVKAYVEAEKLKARVMGSIGGVDPLTGRRASFDGEESGDLLRRASIDRDEANVVTNVMHTPDKSNGNIELGRLNGSTNGTKPRTIVAGDQGAAPTVQDGRLTDVELNSAPSSPRNPSSITMSVYSPASELEDVDLDLDGEEVELPIQV